MFTIKCAAGERVPGKELKTARTDNSFKGFCFKEEQRGRARLVGDKGWGEGTFKEVRYYKMFE